MSHPGHCVERCEVMGITPDETELSLAFKTNVNEGAEAFGRREMDVAFKAWSTAVDIANDSKKKDWIVEITSRLQRLSFECLILQGDECATELFYPTAIEHFTKALNVAVRSGTHEWQDLARSKLSQAHAASFGRCRRERGHLVPGRNEIVLCCASPWKE